MKKMLSWRSRICLVALLTAHAVAAQDQKSAVPQAQRYFSGTVVAQSAESLTVTRTVLGRIQVSRNFLLGPDTVIEGELRERSRVTVKYVDREETLEATHIIVRNPPPKR